MILTATDAPRLPQVVQQGRWRSASATWDFSAAPRIVGPLHLHEVEGLAPASLLSATPVGCPWRATSKPDGPGPPGGHHRASPRANHRQPWHGVQPALSTVFVALCADDSRSSWWFSATGNPRLPSVYCFRVLAGVVQRQNISFPS
jgi:hypothetical protein